MTKFRQTISALGDRYAKYRIRSSRGAVFTSEIDGLLSSFTRGGVVILIINQYFHILTPLWILPAVWIIQKVFEYMMGFIDEYYLGWHKAENNLIACNTNPFLVSLRDKLNEVNNKLDEIKKTP